jgi:hypothetical protein
MSESIKAAAREFILGTNAGQYASEAMLDAYSTDFAAFAQKVADEQIADKWYPIVIEDDLPKESAEYWATTVHGDVVTATYWEDPPSDYYQTDFWMQNFIAWMPKHRRPDPFVKELQEATKDDLTRFANKKIKNRNSEG